MEDFMEDFFATQSKMEISFVDLKAERDETINLHTLKLDFSEIIYQYFVCLFWPSKIKENIHEKYQNVQLLYMYISI